MRDEDRAILAVLVGLIVLFLYIGLSFVAGNITNQLLSPIPSIAGPIGGAVSLGVFVFLLLKTLEKL